MARTVEKLAGTISGGLTNGWNSAVPIHPQGSRPPFFAIHGDGNAPFYRELAQLLGRDQPFYAVESEGWDGRRLVRTSVEAMADYYLRQIREIQPRRPYLLGGYSFGGLVAYEMARRLCLTGAEVALLVFFDTCNPARSRPTFQVDFQNALRNPVALLNPNVVFRFLARQTRGKAAASVLRSHEALHRRLKWRFLGWRMLGRHRASVGPVVAHIETVHELAALAYRPLPYAGRVVLFRSTGQAATDGWQADGGWGHMIRGGLDVHVVPGTHLELLSMENVPLIAERLRTCIQTALPSQE